MSFERLRVLTVAVLVTLVACAASRTVAADRWSADEVEVLRSLWIGSQDPLPRDPGNRHADDTAAARLGHRLFFDPRLSENGRVSCATCHQPDLDFQDGVPLASGVGTTDRRTMPVAGTAHSPWQFWDGRKDSQWAQALGPLESPVEHGGSRAMYAHVIADAYPAEYEAIFGAIPALDGVPRHAGPVADSAAADAWAAMGEDRRDAVTTVFVNIGKAIAAYERRIDFGPSRFDEYVARLVADGRAPAGVLSDDEVGGLRLFVGKAQCINCHNGARFTDDHFHNTGVADAAGLPRDVGRATGAQQVLADEFNCRSRWSDAAAGECAELEFLVPDGHELIRAFKTPSLRNVAERAPYMHAGQLATLADVVTHYDRAPEAPEGHSELRRLRLSARERARLEAFMRALSGPLVAPDGFLGAPRSLLDSLPQTTR